jgi:hypothetical protein
MIASRSAPILSMIVSRKRPMLSIRAVGVIDPLQIGIDLCPGLLGRPINLLNPAAIFALLGVAQTIKYALFEVLAQLCWSTSLPAFAVLLK